MLRNGEDRQTAAVQSLSLSPFEVESVSSVGEHVRRFTSFLSRHSTRHHPRLKASMGAVESFVCSGHQHGEGRV